MGLEGQLCTVYRFSFLLGRCRSWFHHPLWVNGTSSRVFTCSSLTSYCIPTEGHPSFDMVAWLWATYLVGHGIMLWYGSLSWLKKQVYFLISIKEIVRKLTWDKILRWFEGKRYFGVATNLMTFRNGLKFQMNIASGWKAQLKIIKHRK